MITAGIASSRNSHCQPARPSAPSSVSSAEDTGAPITEESGMAAMNSPMMRAR